MGLNTDLNDGYRVLERYHGASPRRVLLGWHSTEGADIDRVAGAQLLYLYLSIVPSCLTLVEGGVRIEFFYVNCDWAPFVNLVAVVFLRLLQIDLFSLADLNLCDFTRLCVFVEVAVLLGLFSLRLLKAAVVISTD